MKTLIILRGIPGSGKSTVAEMLSEGGKYPVCTADDFFMVDGEYKFDASKLYIAHCKCKDKVGYAMAEGYEKIFVANTNTTEKEMNPYFDLAKEFGYQAISLIVENRHGNTNVHGVPDEALEKMRNRFTIKL